MTDFPMEQQIPVAKHSGVKRVIKATGYSLKGLRHAFCNEAAFRQEVIASFFLFPLALLVNVTLVERILLIMSVVVVLVVELLNSSIEAVVDRIGVEYHQLAGAAKDMGSAAVFLSLLFCIYVWVSILFTLF